jgi:hypothetical protein
MSYEGDMGWYYKAYSNIILCWLSLKCIIPYLVQNFGNMELNLQLGTFWFYCFGCVASTNFRSFQGPVRVRSLNPMIGIVCIPCQLLFREI